MRAALFSIVPYERPVAQKGWPVAATDYDADTAQASMGRALDFFELADEVGFDWVSVAEHHYAPGSLTPNPMVMAGALAQRVKRAKIALLGFFMSISSPEMAEFAAEHRISAGLAVTTVPRARDSLRVYREAAARHGWEPSGDEVLCRAAVHVAESDEEAWADCAPFATPDRPIGALSMANPAIDEAVAGSGYYGRETAAQRARVAAAGDLRERLDTGQLLAGAPDTVLRQVESIARELGAGILELAFIAPSPDKRRRSIELFGEQVLPRMRDL